MLVWQWCKKWLGLERGNARQLSNDPPAGRPGQTATPQDNGLREENERLRQRVHKLEVERDRERQFLAALQAEYATQRRSLADWVRAQFTEDELRRFGQEEDEAHCRSLDELMGELEAVVQDRRNA
jgi:hypothetical protein